MKPEIEDEPLLVGRLGEVLPSLRSVRDIPSQAWKNGGGQTKILYETESLRLSVAEIQHDADFSCFPGWMRQMALLEGNGLSLIFANGERKSLQSRGDVLTFPGDVSVRAILHDGGAKVVNLMHSSSSSLALEAMPTVRRRRIGKVSLFAFLSVCGTWTICSDSGARYVCPPGDCFLSTGMHLSKMQVDAQREGLAYQVIAL